MSEKRFDFSKSIILEKKLKIETSYFFKYKSQR